MKLELHHINFATRDVDKMSKFYKKILQLKIETNDLPVLEKKRGYSGDVSFDSGDAIVLLHIVSFLSWIIILIYGIRIKNKAMWKGSLVGIAAAPAFLILGIVWYIEATDWSMF